MAYAGTALDSTRRDWAPRAEELPRVVRIPGQGGAYVVERTFGEAEALRTSWCRNPQDTDAN